MDEIRFIRQHKVRIKHYCIILLFGIRHSMRDLLSGLNNYARPTKMAICVRNGKWCHCFLWYHLALADCESICLSDILDGDLCKKIFYLHISFFLVLKHDFIRCADFTRIAASNTANDDVTNYVTHRIINTYLLHSFAPFVVKIYEKFSLNDGF